MARDKIPDKEFKILISKAGGYCSFPGCNKHLVIAATEQDAEIFIGDFAHIIADSRQGPRGKSEMPAEDRNKYNNLILFCKEHHTTVDKQCQTYSVAVLRQMKSDHEDIVRKRNSGVSDEEPSRELTRDTLYCSALPLTHLPSRVFSAASTFREKDFTKIFDQIRYPEQRQDELYPFLLCDKKLFTFHDLSISDGPFSSIIDIATVACQQSESLWQTTEQRDLYVRLLNQGLRSYFARKGIRYSKEFDRFYFKANGDGSFRKMTYRPLNARHSTRLVVWTPEKRSTKTHRPFWIHLAAKIAFRFVGEKQWLLTVRPEYYLTQDGTIPLDPKKIGPIVTRKKSLMRNSDYLSELNFWVNILSGGAQHVFLHFGNQALFVDSKLIDISIDWPGVPNDIKKFKNTNFEADLIAMMEKNEFLSAEHNEEEYSDE